MYDFPSIFKFGRKIKIVWKSPKTAMSNTWTLVLQYQKQPTFWKAVVEQTYSRRDSFGSPNSVKHLMHNWASPKPCCKTIKEPSDKIQNPKSLSNSNWNKRNPTKPTVSWISLGESKSILEKQLNVGVTTPQSKTLWKSRFPNLTYKNAFTTPNSEIRCLWASRETAKRFKFQLN